MTVKIILLFLGLGLFMGLSAPSWALSDEESQRIEKFLTVLSAQSDLIFIRNGSEYKLNKAVSHLKRKLKQTRRRLQTAEEFIDQVASTSSISGQPYYIRKQGGQNEPAGPYFRQLLIQADRQ
jgi:hypothetical protein